jgi:hypothetical protein
MKKKTAFALSKADTAWNPRPIQHESAAQRFVRRERKSETMRLQSFGFAAQSGKTAIGFFFIVDNDFVDPQMVLEKFPARGLAQQSQLLDWKLSFDFVDQRQRQNGIAQKARLH